jgi:hypothetical protein
VLTAVFRLMMAGGSTLTGASRAMLELKLLENTVLDDICVVGCVVDGVGEVVLSEARTLRLKGHRSPECSVFGGGWIVWGKSCCAGVWRGSC